MLACLIHFVFAFDCLIHFELFLVDEVVDVTRRYTHKWEEVLTRRTVCTCTSVHALCFSLRCEVCSLFFAPLGM